MESIDYQAIAEQLQKELEQARIKLAHSIRPPFYAPFLDTLVRRWNSLTYIEKAYTVAMTIVAACAFFDTCSKIITRRYL